MLFTGILVLAAIFTAIILPATRQTTENQVIQNMTKLLRNITKKLYLGREAKHDKSFKSFFYNNGLLQVRPCSLKLKMYNCPLYSVVSSAASLGFLQATLEPHMRDFHLSPVAVGSMFVITGACYG